MRLCHENGYAKSNVLSAHGLTDWLAFLIQIFSAKSCLKSAGKFGECRSAVARLPGNGERSLAARGEARGESAY